MLAKKSAENQLTLPKEVTDLFPDSDSFDVRVENGKIILKPIQPDRLAQVQNKEEDIRDAIAWARGKKT